FLPYSHLLVLPSFPTRRSSDLEHLRTCLLCADEVSTIRHELARFGPSSESEAFSLWQLLQKPRHITARLVVQPQLVATRQEGPQDRKSTRLNSSHSQISYAVFC